MNKRNPIRIGAMVAGLAVLLTAGARWMSAADGGTSRENPAQTNLALVSQQIARGARESHQSAGLTGTTNSQGHFGTTIRPVKGPPRVRTGLTNFHGQAVTVSCASCHQTTKPQVQTRTGAELDQFHQGLNYAHGGLTCLSCHNSQDYDALRLADGTSVAFENVMQLCGQCHGPQSRDYQRGSHGGMNGYWDLKKGPRVRNSCVHCHDPHSPGYPAAMPVFPPRDRISVKSDPTRKAAH